MAISLLGILTLVFNKSSILGYLILFILMFVEGPIVAYIAAFAASQGYFDVWLVFILFILGNQIPDVLFFKIGQKLKDSTIKRFAGFFGVTHKRVNWIKRNVKTHFIKTTLVTKTVPPLPTAGIVVSGYSKVKFKKFFWVYLVYNVFYAMLFVALGYYSGIAIASFLKYFRLSEFILFAALILVIGLYFLIRLVGKDYLKKLR